MSTPSLGALLAGLVESGHLTAAEEAEVAETTSGLSHELLDPTPWYLRAVIGGAAWIATVFFLGCAGLFLGDLIDEPAAAVLGLGLVVAAGGLLRLEVPRARDAFHQSSLALALTGRSLFAAGVMSLTEEAALTALVMLAFEAAIIAVFHEAAQRWFATLSVVGSLAVLVGETLRENMIATVLLPSVWAAACVLQVLAHRAEAAAWSGLLRPVAWGLIAATFGLLLGWSLEDHQPGSIAVLGLVAASLHLALAAVVKPPGVALIGLGAGLALLLPAGHMAPGLLVGVSLGATGTATRQPALTVLGGATFALSLVWLYWQLDLSFQAKATAMLAPGVLVLLLRPLLHPEVADDA